ncbi:MAG TPA: ribosome-associated translation inhibitor RaiA [Thermomicrobiaceae bacterium]|nr:ribosome-associated translation inhibitor RaiA [Thermomicrobiaceae bacterium]
MDLQIKTRGIQLTPKLEEYVERRLQKLDRVSENVLEAKLELRTEKNRTGGEQAVAQITIATRNAILRAEEKNRDLHTAIDLAADRMARQIRRFHDKRVFTRRRQKAVSEPELAAAAADGLSDIQVDETDELPLEALVRRKRFKIQPLSEGEAIEHMELLGHDFFVFFNPDVAQINVLYRRKNGQYGLIQPELA